MASDKKRKYKVTFLNQGEIYEIYAASVCQPEMYGFIEVEELLFGEHTNIVVDPSEERLKSEFSGVKRSFIPLHSVIRIDEVEKEGVGKIIETKDGSGKVAQFPHSGYVPPHK